MRLKRIRVDIMIIAMVLVAYGVQSAAYAGESVKSLMKKAHALVRQKKNTEAQKIYEQVIAINPRNADAQAGLAWTLFTQGKRDQAEEIAKKAAQLDSKCATAHNVLGAIYFSRGMVEEAKQEFRTVLKLDPNRRCGGCSDLRGFLGNDIPMPTKKRKKASRD